MSIMIALLRASHTQILSAVGLAGVAVHAAGNAKACADGSAERHAYFGDLQIHTGLSADARLLGKSNRPADAHRFARGEEIQIRQTSPGSVPRPLDLAAVTDHAENIGTISLCLTPGTQAYESKGCKLVREPIAQDDMSRCPWT
jgi:hypothetical protein